MADRIVTHRIDEADRLLSKAETVEAVNGSYNGRYRDRV
jgi:hypothetical protein